MTGDSTRRRFLEITGAAAGMAGLAGAVGSATLGAPDSQPAAAAGRRPKVAALATVYNYLSHAYHIVGRFIDGFPVYDGHGLHKPPFRDRQPVHRANAGKRPTWAEPRPSRHGIRQSPTIADALTLGTGKLAVDAVLLIAEHGEYPYNEKLQKLYPRGRFFRRSARSFQVVGPRRPRLYRQAPLVQPGRSERDGRRRPGA